MTKTKKELEQIKNECKTLTNKLSELSDDELDMVTGGYAKAWTHGVAFSKPAVFVKGLSFMGSPTMFNDVDGVTTKPNINELNPSDIESIEVLKD